jgi:hypothetical protein
LRSSHKLSDEEIIKKCVTCAQGKWRHGVHYCLRNTCKYRTSRTSIYFKEK